MTKLWGGRFQGKLDPLVERLNASLPVDKRLAREDVLGSLAWARGLQQAGVLPSEDATKIESGLQTILAEFEAGKFEFAPSDEDIHTAVERRLGELIGPAAGRLHTGRSRNDQIATDLRLWLLGELRALDSELRAVQASLLARAESDFGIVLPGYTHLQRAQPILLSHWWLAHLWPLQRDRERLANLRARTSQLPLGSGALAGSAFPIDREALARELGFDSVSPNSLDAVADRDFAAEFLFDAALIGVHLSRLAEALIVFASAEFGFVELDDAFATGSSLMPQKKNPDPLELLRGKAGTLIGRLCGMLATLKGLPSAYDKDLQEDKPAVFEAADTLRLALPVAAGLLRTIHLNPERMQAALDPGLLATDLADHLVRNGVPFREAHAAVGKAVRRAHELGLPLAGLSASELKSIHASLDASALEALDVQRALEKRNIPGGTGPAAVRHQIERARESIA